MMNNKIQKLPMSLPEVLDEKNQLFYFQEMAKGNKEARQQLIEHNLRFVVHEIYKKYSHVSLDIDELFSIGVVGLIKAVDNFDYTKYVSFSNYAGDIINGNIKNYLRKQGETLKTVSMESFITGTDDSLKISDTLTDEKDFTLDIIEQDVYRIIDELVEALTEPEREITKMIFGFSQPEPFTQMEVAKILNISQARVSRTIKKVTEKIKMALYEQKIIEKTDLTIKERYKEKTPVSKENTIYKLLKYYTKEQVDDMLSRLNAEEQKLIQMKYGNDLEHPQSTKEWEIKSNREKFRNLYRKMRYLLNNPTKVSYEREKPKEFKRTLKK